MPAELRKRLPIVVLMVIVLAATFYDWVFGLGSWMAVPGEISRAWELLLMGNFSSGVISEMATLIGANLLHGDGHHLLGNMLLFWIFGAVVLEIVGWRWLVAIALTSGIGAVACHVLLDPESPIPMLGASGVVMGFEGAYLGLAVKRPRGNTQVWPLAHPVRPIQLAAVGVIGIFFDFSGITGSEVTNVAYGAHIGGFVTGIVMSLLRRG